TPANRISLRAYFGTFLAKNLDNCATCHQALPGGKVGATLKEFPHNPFGDRLRLLGDDLRKAGKKADIGTRVRAVASEDSDSDGVDNLTELLLGHMPGDPGDKPSRAELARAPKLKAEFFAFLSTYRW